MQTICVMLMAETRVWADSTKQASSVRQKIPISVHFVEMDYDYTRNPRFGIFASETRQQDKSQTAVITGTISNLLPKLNWAKGHGFARILQVESLMIEDGGTGVVKTKLPNESVYAGKAIHTSINPSVLERRSDNIRLSLAFSVKGLAGVEADPKTSNREIQTVINVQSGQSAAVRALIPDDNGMDELRSPTAISLNSSAVFHHRHRLVIFITPTFKTSASAAPDKTKKNFRVEQ